MYNFRPSPEQQAIVDKVRKLMDELVYPNEQHFVEHQGLPQHILKSLQERVKQEGLWAPHMSKEAGGLGMGYITLGLISEVLGRSPIAPRIFGCKPPDAGNMEVLWAYGTPEQREKWCAPLLTGEVRSCFAMTEPEVSGSDPTTLQCRAELDGDEWVINGHKWFATGAIGAEFAIVMVVTDPEAPSVHRRASMIIVPTGTPGYEIVRAIPVMGDTYEGGHCELRFTNCRVPAQNLLGERAKGFQLAQVRLNTGRIIHCMHWLGLASRSLELMLGYVQKRKTRGTKLAEFQTIQNWIADSWAEIQSSRLLTLHAAWKMDEGDEARTEVSLIKFWGAKVMLDVIDRAIQAHGSLGFTGDLPLEGFYREARGARILDGPDEVHRMVVARRILRDYNAGTLGHQ